VNAYFVFMYFKYFISIYMYDLSLRDYVWGIINYGMVLLRFYFFSKKKRKEGEKRRESRPKKRENKTKKGRGIFIT